MNWSVRVERAADEIIARRLGMSEPAVGMPPRSVFAKLQFESRDEACLFAAADGAEPRNIRDGIRTRSRVEDGFLPNRSVVWGSLEQLEEYPK